MQRIWKDLCDEYNSARHVPPIPSKRPQLPPLKVGRPLNRSVVELIRKIREVSHAAKSIRKTINALKEHGFDIPSTTLRRTLKQLVNKQVCVKRDRTWWIVHKLFEGSP